MRQIHIIGGGTVFNIRPHLALAAPAYGQVVRDLMGQLYQSDFDGIVHAYYTKMAGNAHHVWTARSGLDGDVSLNLETNDDIAKLVDTLVKDPAPKIIFMPVALCDFDVVKVEADDNSEWEDITGYGLSGKYGSRLTTSRGEHRLTIVPAAKIISRVRKTRKDIFLVGFKTTTGATAQEQFNAGLTLVKQASCNLVLANDITTRLNMVVTPEQAPYYVSMDRRHTLRQLVGMTLERSKGHFTRSEVHADAPLVPWNSDRIPDSLRTVVNHCIKRGAYKPFMGKTVGHFALRAPSNDPVRAHETPPTFITSRRGVDFNELDKVGMVMVQAFGDDRVVADGAKPSVGGQSQRIIFANHPELDCIVHFHCPLRPDPVKTQRQESFFMPPARIEVRSQGPYECGSHECGQNTSDGLTSVLVDGKGTPMLKAVMLDKHGPNIVFNARVHPSKVIDFIERYWDLERSTSEVPL